MGDRIKFGPEWLRNLAPGTSSSPGSGGNNQNAGMSNAGASGSALPAASTSNAPNTPTSSKILLAKLRYGREEMLALYNRESDAPSELKSVDVLYQPRGKPPFALNNTFEDDMRDNMRSGPPTGNASSGERFSMPRGRGLNVNDGRGRPRVPFVRSPNAARVHTFHSSWNNQRMPMYSGAADDDSTLNLRSSWSGSNGGNAPNRNTGGEQAEWTPSKMFRSKRQNQATNWRQSREEGEEWRSPDAGRSRGNNQQDKWERDWGDRPNQDKPQSWNNNRRTWVGGDQNEENLPEWAVENAEACGGTFDSSGAFHGYSNDDTNLKNQEPTLTRSHNAYVISKSVEEGSEEWWASEKAKKLSPKRFETSDKFKKQTSVTEQSDSGSDAKPGGSKEEAQRPRYFDSLSNASCSEIDIAGMHDALLRSDMNIEDNTDNCGNFQSVMINPNNGLRQKHQNIVSAGSDVPIRDSNNDNPLLQMTPNSGNQMLENEMPKHHQEDKTVDDIIFDLTLEEKDIIQKTPKAISSPMNQPTSMASVMASPNSMPPLQNPAMQMRLSSPAFANSGLMAANPNIPMPGMQGLPAGLQGLPAGIQPGLQIPGLPPSMQVAGMQHMGMHGVGILPSGIQGVGNQTPGTPGSAPMMPNSLPQMQGMQQPMQGMQGQGLQAPGIQASGMQSMQNVGITNSVLNASLGLPVRPGNNGIGMPIQGVPPPVMPNSGMGNPGMGGSNMQGAMGGGQMQAPGGGIQPFSNSGGLITGMSGANSSLFMSQNSNSSTMGNQGDIPMPNQHGQSNMFPMHGLQQPSNMSQGAFGSSLYSSIMQQQAQNQNLPQPSAGDMWYYEDPEKNIQGPFTSKEMYNWYRAGFFSPSLMVRRACDAHMHPLGSYGPVVPFSQRDMLSSFPLTTGFDRSAGPHESMLNSQQALGLESVMNMSNLNDAPTMDPMQFGSVGLIRNPPFGQQQPMVDSLWSQSCSSTDMLWMQQAMSRNDNRVNNLPMYFWDQQEYN